MAKESEGGTQVVWIPLSVRSDPILLEEFQAVQEGVADGARQPLAAWVRSTFEERGTNWYRQMIEQFGMMANRQFPDYLLSSGFDWEMYLREDDELLLDAVDFALRWASELRLVELADILLYSRSAYRIAKDSNDHSVLQRSYPDELLEMVDATAIQPGRAAEHLRIAWTKLAGRNPDFDKACWDATKAVEVAAKPVVSPNDDTTHLGKMIGEMAKHPERWECDLSPDESVERIVGMMSIVWQEGRRHGDETQPIYVSQESAEIVVQTAVVLVHWFDSNYIRALAA